MHCIVLKVLKIFDVKMYLLAISNTSAHCCYSSVNAAFVSLQQDNMDVRALCIRLCEYFLISTWPYCIFFVFTLRYSNRMHFCDPVIRCDDTFTLSCKSQKENVKLCCVSLVMASMILLGAQDLKIGVYMLFSHLY